LEKKLIDDDVLNDSLLVRGRRS